MVAFEWDSGKAERNFAKHGIAFEEARTVFNDPLSSTIHDVKHSIHEDRYLTVGSTISGKLIVVSHCDRGDAVRIICARPLTKRERRDYEHG